MGRFRGTIPAKLAASSTDREFFSHVVMDAWKTFFKKIEIWKWKNTPDEASKIYLESPDRILYSAYSVEGYVDDKPGWDPNLTKAGMDSTRELKCHFSVDMLREMNVEWPLIGDLLVIDDQYYEIKDTDPMDNFANQEYQLIYSVFMRLYHHDKVNPPRRGRSVR